MDSDRHYRLTVDQALAMLPPMLEKPVLNDKENLPPAGEFLNIPSKEFTLGKRGMATLERKRSDTDISPTFCPALKGMFISKNVNAGINVEDNIKIQLKCSPGLSKDP